MFTLTGRTFIAYEDTHLGLSTVALLTQSQGNTNEDEWFTLLVNLIKSNSKIYIASFRGMRDVGESYGVNFTNFDLCRHLFKQYANTSIANTYPILASECMRQNALLFDWHPRRDTYRNIQYNLAA